MTALERNDYNIAHAALQLRIGRSTIHRMMRRYGVQLSDPVKLYARAPANHAGVTIVFDGAEYVFDLG